MNTITRPRLPATLGDPQEFAVVVDLDDAFHAEWLFGKVGYIIGGVSVGDYNLGTSLRDVLVQMQLIVSDSGVRHTHRLVGLPKNNLFSLVWTALYGEKDRELDQIAEHECWAKHNITLPIDVFDGVRVFQFDEGAVSRILWRFTTDNDDRAVHEVDVSLGCTEDVFSRLSNLLIEVSAWEESMRAP